ncbi:MAG: T9SS type A sorting domain-containing protein [Bacteroidetes bacterium]|nr:T9SS type A sorting domain-containing protein [Bacteroidota bacterium]
MKRVLIVLIGILLYSGVHSQWINKSASITSSLQTIKRLDSTFFLFGNNYLYSSVDTGRTVFLAGYDSLNTFNEVSKNKDTFYVLSYNTLDTITTYTKKIFKIFPGIKTVDMASSVKFPSDYKDHVLNFHDSIIFIHNLSIQKPNNYFIYVVSGLTNPATAFYGGFARVYFYQEKVEFKNYFVRDSTLFILNNYEPQQGKNLTLIVRRAIKKITPDISQFDSIINLPFANALFMFNDSAGIIIGDTYIAKSLNYTTWDIKYNCPNCNFKQVWFTSKDTGYVVGSKNGKALILKSMDGGVTWREQVCPVTAPLNDIKFTDDGKAGLIVGDSGTILRTENGGGTSFVGINSSKIKSPNFNLYPNPANNQLTIVNYHLPIHTTYSIYTIQGKLLQEGLVQENETIMDIHKYHPGLYFITIGTTTLKFVKQ